MPLHFLRDDDLSPAEQAEVSPRLSRQVAAIVWRTFGQERS